MSSFPACIVCQQNFSLKGPAPFLLPCLHSVCETCITSAAGGVISCNPCHREVNLTETGLQKDVITEKEVLHKTVQHIPELLLSTHDDGNQAVCWYTETFRSEECQNVHDSLKTTKQHTIYDFGELEHGNLNEDRHCRIHPKFIADKWDTHCSKLTCRKCRLGGHFGHKSVEIEGAAQSSRRALATLQEEVKSVANIHAALSKAATSELQSSAKSSSILPEKIRHTFNSLKTILDQKEEELRIAQGQQGEILETLLKEKKKSSDIFHQRCQATSDYISKTLKYSSMHDIVELRPLLEEKSKDCRNLASSEDYDSLPIPVFIIERLANIKSTLGKFGVITTDDAVAENKTQDMETQTEDGVIEQLEEKEQTNTSDIGQGSDRKKLTWGDGFKHWLLNKDMKLLVPVVIAVLASFLLVSHQQLSDCEYLTEIMTQKLRQIETFKGYQSEMEFAREGQTQTEVLTKKLKQMETLVENLTRENMGLTRDCESKTEIMTKKMKQREMSEENLIKEKRQLERGTNL